MKAAWGRVVGMHSVTRRGFLGLLGGAAAASAVPDALAAPKPAAFEFLFITDSHLEPELSGVEGTSVAFKKARAHRVDFALQGGDHVFDAMNVSKERAVQLFDLYGKTEQDLGMKVYHTCGNHDCFGIASKGKIAPGDRLYGKKMYEERFGPAKYSFDHKGVHFVVLDSVLPTTANPHGYVGRIEDDQLQWLAADLEKLPKGTPIIVSTHMPLVTAAESYEKLAANRQSLRGTLSVDNSEQVLPILEQYNVLGVLQGHNHIEESVTYRGITYTIGGAVCGNWWKGPYMGTPEGYMVVRVENGKMTTRYVRSGWVARS